MKIKTKASKIIRIACDPLLKFLGLEITKKSPLCYLHSYSSYEEYKEVQIYHNKRKLSQVWADDATLVKVAEIARASSGGNKRDLAGLCHGSRNGYEVSTLGNLLGGNSKVLGTDISETASQFSNMLTWDFHDINPEWIGAFDFVYTNSLDQSCKPVMAIQTWLQQLNPNGVLIIEHTRAHGVEGASEMDPFGVQPEFMPYFLADSFGKLISVSIEKTIKSNKNIECWLFIVSPAIR